MLRTVIVFVFVAGLAVAAEPAADGFVPLFNGKDLSGWKVPPGDNGHWKVVDGVIDYDARSESKERDKSLWSDRNFKDFVLRLDWRLKTDEPGYLNPRMKQILPDGSHKKTPDGKDDDLTREPRPAAPERAEDKPHRPDRPDTTTPPADDATPPQDDPPVDDDAARPPPEDPSPAPDPSDPGTGTGNPGDPGDDDPGDDPGDDDGWHGGDRAGATTQPGWDHGRGHGRGHGRHGGHHDAPRPAAAPRDA